MDETIDVEVGVYQYFGESITSAIEYFLTPASTALIDGLGELANTGVTLYITLFGMLVILGAVDMPLRKGLMIAAKIVFVGAIALNTNTYSEYVIGGFQSLQLGMIDVMNVSEGGTPYAVLDEALARGAELAVLAYERANDSGWHFGDVIMWDLCGIAIMIAASLITAAGFGIVVMAEVALNIMMALGPFFILLAIFPMTQRIFDGWFSQSMNYTLLGVIVSVILMFCVAALNKFLLGADITSKDVSPVIVTGQVIALGIVSCYLIWQAPGMAAGLGGGLSMAALTFAHMAAPYRGYKQAVNPVSIRRDAQSGMMATGTRVDHIAAGNTLINPAYWQQNIKNIGRNWGWRAGGKAREDRS